MVSFVLAVPSHAADPVPAPAVAVAAKAPELLDKESAKELGAAIKELNAAMAGERNFGKQLELYAKFQFSPELRPKLKEIFGSERPFPLERVPGAAKGQIDYVAKLAPHTYKANNGLQFSWTELVSNISTDKTGRTLNATASWPSLDALGTAGGSFSAVNMTMTSKQARGKDNVNYGTASFKVGVMSFRDVPAGATESKEVARAEGMEVRSDVSRKGAMAEIGSRTSIKALVVGGEQVDNINFAFRVTNVPAKSLADLDKLMSAQQASKAPAEEQQKRLMKDLTAFGKRAAIAGATLVIDDISAAYHGNTASIKGRLGFQKVVEADFNNVLTLAKKLVARFDVRVPVALVKDIGRAFAAKSVDPSAPDAQQQIDKGADGVVSMVVGKAVSGGYAVLEKGELRTAIEFKGGKLIVNGKDIEVLQQLQALSAKFAEEKAKQEAASEAEEK